MSNKTITFKCNECVMFGKRQDLKTRELFKRAIKDRIEEALNS